MAIIFDLDQTLIDSAPLDGLRRQRRWSDVYRGIRNCTIYSGIPELLSELQARHIPMAIITSTPSSYCHRVLRTHGIPITTTVCYHDTVQHKPHPAPILAGLRALGVAPDYAVAVGDAVNDVRAAQAAGVLAVAAMWGAADPEALGNCGADYCCRTVAELREFLLERYGQ